MFRLFTKILPVPAAVFAVAATVMPAAAKEQPDYIPPAEERVRIVPQFYADAQWIILDGDSMPCFTLRNITVYPPLKFKNKKEEEFYHRTVRNVKILLPYAKMIRETLVETYEYIETFPTQKEREAYLKMMEKSLFEQYKPVLKRFSRRQARLLVKLIQRETEQSSYDIVKAFLGSFRAAFWQGFGRLFGVSLKGKYNPAKNREDMIIERICTQVEQGTL